MNTAEAIQDKLTESEQKRKSFCEVHIHTKSAAWFAVNEAYEEILNSRLYRDTHRTFEEYCQATWNRNGRSIRNAIKSMQMQRELAGVPEVHEVMNFGGSAPILSIQAATELSKLPPDQAKEVYEELKATGAVTAERVKAARKESTQSEPEQPCSKSFNFGLRQEKLAEQCIKLVESASTHDELNLAEKYLARVSAEIQRKRESLHQDKAA